MSVKKSLRGITITIDSIGRYQLQVDLNGAPPFHAGILLSPDDPAHWVTSQFERLARLLKEGEEL